MRGIRVESPGRRHMLPKRLCRRCATRVGGAQIGVLVTPGSLISPQAIASNNAAAAGAMSSEAQREQAPPAPELPDALCPSQT